MFTSETININTELGWGDKGVHLRDRRERVKRETMDSEEGPPGQSEHENVMERLRPLEWAPGRGEGVLPTPPWDPPPGNTGREGSRDQQPCPRGLLMLHACARIHSSYPVWLSETPTVQSSSPRRGRGWGQGLVSSTPSPLPCHPLFSQEVPKYWLSRK